MFIFCVFICLLCGRGRACFFAVWAARLVFLLFGRGGGGEVGGGGVRVFFFLLFGRGTGVHSLAGLPGSSLSDPTTKKTKQQKKKQRVPPLNPNP